MAEGYRLNWTYRLEPDDYPSEETARAIIAAVETIARGEASYRDLDKVSGVEDATIVGARCFMVYGFPELAPGKVATALNDAMKAQQSQRRRSTTTTTTTNTPSTAAPKPRPEVTYGFTNRAAEPNRQEPQR